MQSSPRPLTRIRTKFRDGRPAYRHEVKRRPLKAFETVGYVCLVVGARVKVGIGR